MVKITFGILAFAASLMLVSSLTCNNCNFGLFGYCFNSQKQTCETNVTSCFTGKATFPKLSFFSGFNSQGCLDNVTACNTTLSATILSITYTTTTTCCSSDSCNPIQSGSPSTKMTLTGAVSAAILALVLGSKL